MNKFEEDLKNIKQFYETVMVLPELETFRKNPPVEIYGIIERSSSEEIWEHISQIFKIVMANECATSAMIVSDLIPSLLWAHVRGIIEKKSNLRNSCEKILLMIYFDKRFFDFVKRFNEVIVREPLFHEEDKEAKKQWTISNDDMLRRDPNSTRLSDLSSVYNSILVNVDGSVKGITSMSSQLKYIPISQCLNIYSFLLDIVCYHSSMITNHCFLSLFRLIHRMCRVGYPPNLFSEPAKLLNTEDTQLIMNPSYVRVTLSNYLVERFSFLLLRSVFCGFVDEASLCSKDLHVVVLRQNLFISLNGILSLNRFISKFYDGETIKRRDFFMFNPKNLK